MPIDYKNYPSNWKSEIRPAILERANNCCEFCNIINYSLGYRDVNGIFYSAEKIIQALENNGYDYFEHELNNCYNKKGEPTKPIKIVLTIAHLDHDTNNNDYSNLKALCQKCHLIYDKEHHAKNSRETRVKKKKQIEINF